MDMDRYIGRLLDGRYEILEVIGTGGMAVVYKARCHRLNRLVAVKILKDELSRDEEFRRRFHAESQAVAMFSHPNIVSVYDVSTSDDADYIVMELIDGITLKQYMEKKGVLNWKETLHFAIQIAKALEHAHSRGIIHRDIKPHNVMVLKNGSVKVADFGIAQVMSKGNTLTKEALGSVHYISPEQAKGGRVDNRSDLYSLGVVMYEMMTGRPPYDGDTPVSVAIQHINGKAVMPSTLNPNIPGGLEQIIMKAMAQDPDKRYANATAMLDDMDEFRKDPTILFDYNNPSAGMDDATMIHSTAAINEAASASVHTTAEKTAAKANGEKLHRQTAPRQQPARKKKKRREEVVEEEDRGGKIAAIVAVICSIAAIIALLFLLQNNLGDMQGLPNSQNMVTVPELRGKLYDDVLGSTDYKLQIEKYTYSDVYGAGRIISQNPDANTQIEKGDTISIVVSYGKEPSVKTMEGLIGSTQTNAVNFLVNTQGVDPNLILVVQENSDADAGTVIRTDPVQGEPLEEGEAITLYVSKGPVVKKEKMQDFTNGYNEESAIKWLDLMGFKNYDIVYVESDKAAGVIISQSIPAGTEVDVNSPVVLVVSRGSEKEPTVPPAVNTDPEDYVSRRVKIAMPDDLTKDYLVSVYRDGVLMEERDVPVGTIYTEFILTGKGVMEFDVELSTGAKWTIEVDFDAPEETEDPVEDPNAVEEETVE